MFFIKTWSILLLLVDFIMKMTQKLEIIPRLESLRTLGIGMEYHPRFINKSRKNRHSLDIILMSFIIHGEVLHHLDDEVYPESDMSLSVINYGQQHCITTLDSGAEIMNIFLDLKHDIIPVLPDKLQDSLPLFLPIHPGIQHRLNRMVGIKFDDNDEILHILMQMHDEFQQQAPGFEAAVKDYFRIFLIKCARRVKMRHLKPAAKIHSDSEKRLEKLRLFIDRHYHQHFGIAHLAGMAGFSPNYLCRLFKTYTGRSLIEYTNERRIQAAMLLLKTTSKQIIDIAGQSGFNDLSHFNHVFRKIAGTSPGKFRKE